MKDVKLFVSGMNARCTGPTAALGQRHVEQLFHSGPAMRAAKPRADQTDFDSPVVKRRLFLQTHAAFARRLRNRSDER